MTGEPLQTSRRAGRPSATRSSPSCRSCSRSAAASPATACGRRSRRWASGFRSRCTRFRAGRQVLDWTVPDEWNVRDAYIARDGRRIVDFHESNLHLVSYSEPFRGTMSLRDLRPHLHSLPDHPRWVPYRTSYYSRTWGFCLAQEQLDRLEEAEYEVVVDSTLAPGSLTYGECFLPGEREDEVLLTTHVCHPSLANDNLSGIAVLTELGALLQRRSTHLLLPPALHPGDDRLDHVARAEQATRRQDRGRACPRMPRRQRAADLQAKPARRRDRVDRAAAYALPRVDERGAHRRLHTVGMGRASVQLSRLRPSRRLPQPLARRRVRGVPLVRRQHRPRSRRGARARPWRPSSSSSTSSRATGAT